MRPKITALGLATGAELDALDAAARRHLADPDTLTVPVTYFLAWARKPKGALTSPPAAVTSE